MINSIDEALTIYATYITGKQTLSKLYKLREAIYYLIANRGKVMQHGAQKIDFEGMQMILDRIEKKIEQQEKAENGMSFIKGRTRY